MCKEDREEYAMLDNLLRYKKESDGFYVRIDGHGDDWDGPFENKFDARKCIHDVFEF